MKMASTISTLTGSRSCIPERPWSGELSRFNSCRRESSPDHGLSGIQDLEPVSVLIVEALFLKHGPNFLRREFASPFHEVVRNPWPAVGKAVKWLLRRVIHKFLFGKRKELRANGTGRQEGNRAPAQKCMNAPFAARANGAPSHRCLLYWGRWGRRSHLCKCEPRPGLTILKLRTKLSKDR